jgi:hypothetical protein
MLSNIRSASIGQASKLDKKNQQGQSQVRYLVNDPNNNNQTTERQKSQVSIVHQNSMTSTSNIQNGSFRELSSTNKKAIHISGNRYGIESVIENIKVVKGVRIIHNGQVKKEFIPTAVPNQADISKITKSEFSKM